MKRLALLILTAGVTLLGFFLLWMFRPALALFGGSLALSAALRPLVQQLEGRRVGRGTAILLWYLIILAGIMIIVLIYGLGIVSDITSASAQLPQLYDSAIDSWRHGTSIEQTIAHSMPSFSMLMQSEALGGLLTAAGNTAAGMIGNLILAVAALSLSYYWLMEVTRFERLWLSLLPVGKRVHARDIWRRTEVAVGAYIRVTVVAVMTASLLLLALFSLLRLPFTTALALLGGLGQLVPLLGPVLTLIPALLVAGLRSPLEVVLVLAGGGAIQVLTNRFAVRAMQAEALKVNPLLQVLLLLALAELGGLGAMLFAPPLAALIQVLYSNLLAATTERRPQEHALDTLSERLDRLQTTAASSRREMASTLRRSSEILRQARDLFGDIQN